MLSKDLGQAKIVAKHVILYVILYVILFGAHYSLKQQDIYQGKPG